MRALLVKPRIVSDSVQPSLGLGFLAATAGPHEVAIHDDVLHAGGPDAVVQRARAWGAGAVGFQLNSFDVRSTAPYLARLRAELPGVVTLAGGPHPTALPEETLHLFGARLDYVIRGEGEDGFRRLLDALAAGSPGPEALAAVPGLAWRGADGAVRRNPTAVTDLETLPPPRWDLLDPGRYPPAPHAAFFRRFPVAPVAVSRGCPYPCSFCAGSLVHRREVRYRRIEAVLEELTTLHDRHGVREIHFVDDNLTYDAERAHALCAGLRSLPFRLAWSCPNGVRLDRMDRALADHMRAAGCYSVGVGIEAGSDRILRRIRKGLDLAIIRRQVRMLHDAGLETRGFFVLGFPTETRREMAATVDLALELPLDFAHFMLFHPFPGTRAYEEVTREGGAASIDWSAETLAEVAYAPSGMTARELKAIQRGAFVRFYARPRAAARLAMRVRSGRHALWLARRMVRWLR
ncbi:MAG TPA: radical SAM protein [Anaeromyxobacter sp.]|nr:radical SAM protein [Anaeromyxobacter sp.]